MKPEDIKIMEQNLAVALDLIYQVADNERRKLLNIMKEYLEEASDD